MLPPGHIAAGYLVATKIANSAQISLTDSQHSWIILAGLFFSFAPDLDMFFTFARARSFVLNKTKENHRRYISHAPSLWFFVGALAWPFLTSDFSRILLLTALFSALSHFVLDSIQVGVMWLWPLNHNRYALYTNEPDMVRKPPRFWDFWVEFVKFYTQKLTLTFIAEILVILLALFVLFK